MNHETMTIHSALCELKMLDKRIQKKIRDTQFCTNVRHSISKINGKPISEYEKNVREAYDSIVGMIARRKAIRNALSLSNAKTIVRIQGVEYTVAEAIEMRKMGIENECLLEDNLRELQAHRRDRERREAVREGGRIRSRPVRLQGEGQQRGGQRCS